MHNSFMREIQKNYSHFMARLMLAVIMHLLTCAHAQLDLPHPAANPLPENLSDLQLNGVTFEASGRNFLTNHESIQEYAITDDGSLILGQSYVHPSENSSTRSVVRSSDGRIYFLVYHDLPFDAYRTDIYRYDIDTRSTSFFMSCDFWVSSCSINSKAIYSRNSATGVVLRIDLSTKIITQAPQLYRVSYAADWSVHHGVTACEGWVAIWQSNMQSFDSTPVARVSQLLALNEETLEEVGVAPESYSQRILSAQSVGNRLLTTTGYQAGSNYAIDQISLWSGSALSSPSSINLNNVPAPTVGMRDFLLTRSSTKIAAFVNPVVRGNGLWVNYHYSDANYHSMMHYRITDDGKLLFDMQAVTNYPVSAGRNRLRFYTDQKALAYTPFLHQGGQDFANVQWSLYDLSAPRTVMAMEAVHQPESSSSHYINVSLSSPALTPVSFRLDTISDTAIEGEDFSPIHQTFTIPVGQTKIMIPIKFFEDLLREGYELFHTRISAVSGVYLDRVQVSHTISAKPISIAGSSFTSLYDLKMFEDGSYITFHSTAQLYKRNAVYSTTNAAFPTLILQNFSEYMVPYTFWKTGDVIYAAGNSFIGSHSWSAKTGAYFGYSVGSFSGHVTSLVPTGKGYHFTNTKNSISLRSLADSELDEIYHISPPLYNDSIENIGYSVSNDYVLITDVPGSSYSLGGAFADFSIRAVVFRRSDGAKLLDISLTDMLGCSKECKMVGETLIIDRGKIAIDLNSGQVKWMQRKPSMVYNFAATAKHILLNIEGKLYSRDITTGATQGPIELPQSPDSYPPNLFQIIALDQTFFIHNGSQWFASNPEYAIFPRVRNSEIVIQKKNDDLVLDLVLEDTIPELTKVDLELVASANLKKGLALIQNQIILQGNANHLNIPISIYDSDLRLENDERKFEIKITYTVGSKINIQVLNGFVIDNINQIYSGARHVVHASTTHAEASRIIVGNQHYAIHYPKSRNQQQGLGVVEIYRISDDQLLHVLQPPSSLDGLFGAELAFIDDMLIVNHASMTTPQVYAFDANTGQLKNTFSIPKKQQNFGYLIRTSPQGLAICSKAEVFKSGSRGAPSISTYVSYINYFDKKTFKMVWSKKIPYDLQSLAYNGDYFFAGLPDLSVQWKNPETKKKEIIQQVGGVISFHQAKGKSGPSFSSLFPENYSRVGQSVNAVAGRIWANGSFADQTTAFNGQVRKGIISWNSSVTSYYGLGGDFSGEQQFSENHWGNIVISNRYGCSVLDQVTGKVLYQTNFGFAKAVNDTLPPATPGVAIGQFLFVHHNGVVYKFPFRSIGGYDNWAKYEHNSPVPATPEVDLNSNGVADFDDYVQHINIAFGPILEWEYPTTYITEDGINIVYRGRAALGKYFYSADMMWQHGEAEPGRVFSGYKTNVLAWRTNFQPYLTIEVEKLDSISYAPRYWW